MKSARPYHLYLIAALAFLAAAVPAQAADHSADSEPQFTSGIDDLPLMPGLKSEQEDDVVFAVPHKGRIAETEASGSVPIDEVYSYYRKSLPHLGWKVVDGRTYEREGERLRIDAQQADDKTTVKFSVKPAS